MKLVLGLTLLSVLIAYISAELQCPEVQPGTSGICVEECSSDGECDKTEKCCSNGCGHTCQTAVEDTDPCESHSCPQGEECYLQEVQCIRAPCNPVPACRAVEDTDPCESHSCSQGEECYLQEVQCIRAPCNPVPACRTELQCPEVPPGTSGICVEECSSNGDCDKTEKCCSNGCGHTCQTAVTKKDPCESHSCPQGEECYLQEVQCVRAPCDPVPACRAGREASESQCPEVPPGTVGTCVEECSGDADCDKTEKCCSNGCGHTCQTAVTKKDPCESHSCPQGEECYLQEVQCVRAPCDPVPTCREASESQCPEVPPGTVGTCVEECNGDADCDKTEKCCSNGCGHTCQSTVLRSQTECHSMNCTDSCNSGYVSDENGCNTCRCSDACELHSCQEGEECVLKEVQCVKAPCDPVPDCTQVSFANSLQTSLSLGALCILSVLMVELTRKLF